MTAWKNAFCLYLLSLPTWAVEWPLVIGPESIGSASVSHTIHPDKPGRVAIWIKQHTADVVVRVYSEGNLIAGPVNAPGHTQVGEILPVDHSSLPFEVQIELATAGSAPGHYVLEVDRLEPGSVTEQAVDHQYRAALAFQRQTKVAKLESLKLYLSAAKLWNLEGRDRSEVEARLGAGILAFILGEKQHAEEIFTGLLEGSVPGTEHKTALILGYLGRLEFQQGHKERAERYYRQALELQTDEDQAHGRAFTLNNLALMHHVTGKLDQAVRLYGQSLKLFQIVGNRNEAATLMNNIGGIHYMRGKPAEAIVQFELALALHTETNNVSGQADAMGNIAQTHRLTGRDVDFIDATLKVLDFRTKMADEVGIARAKQRLGSAYLSIGAFDRAISMLEAAKSARVQLNEQRSLASTLRELGLAYALAGDAKAALETLTRAESLSIQAGEVGKAAEAMLARAQVESGLIKGLKSPSSTEGIKTARMAISKLLDTQDRWRYGPALATLAEIEQAGGQIADSQRTAENALTYLLETGDPLGLVRAYATLARGQYLTGKYQDSSRSVEHAERIAAAQRSRIANPMLRAVYQASVRGVLETKIALLTRQGSDPEQMREAFDLVESNKASSMKELLAKRKRPQPQQQGVADSLADQLSALAFLRQDQLSKSPTSENIAALNSQIVDILTRMDQQHELEARRTGQSSSKPTTANDQDRKLPEHTTLVSFHLQQDQGFAWILNADGGFEQTQIPGRASLDPLILKAIKEVRAPVSLDTPALRELSEALLTPIYQQLTGTKIVFVPDQSLFQVPFSALYIPGSKKRLIEQFELGFLHSAKLPVQTTGNRIPHGALLVGDPNFEGSDRAASDVDDYTMTPSVVAPFFAARQTNLLRSSATMGRLPHTRREVESIARSLTDIPSTIMTGYAANKPAFLAAGPGAFEILHFATHGIVVNQYPELSSLMFSTMDQQRKPVDPMLTVSEILNLQLSAKLVVLSACDSSLGVQLDSEGLFGLSYSFLAAGAGAVVATLWPVRDRSTARFMSNFYRYYAQFEGEIGTALRNAQLDMLNDPRTRHPSYWAGFVHFGH